MKHYLWIDLETTGLDADRCGIIEIAAVLTTDCMNVIEVYESLVEGTHKWEAGAQKLHLENGLISRLCEGVLKHPETIELDILRMLDDRDVKRPTLAGSSVHFDRTFIRRYMRHLDDELDYRHLDVSAITEMMRGLGYELPNAPPSDHTAMADIERSMALYRYWREVIGYNSN